MDALHTLLATHHRGVLATLKRDGRPQLSTVAYAYQPERQLVRISTTAERAKARNLGRDPRASLHVASADGSAWAVAEGTARLTEVARDAQDATVAELVDLYRQVRGEHPDWDEFRAAMVAEHRLAVLLTVERVYGNAH